MAQGKEKENQNRYFPHDIEASTDEKFTVMNYFFRRVKENNLDSLITKSLLPYAAYGLYWKTIEHLHKHTIQVDKLCFLADEWRIEEDFFKLVLENFNLFEVQDDEYISRRVLKNLEEQKKRSKLAKEKANKRWNATANAKEPTEEEKEALKKATAYLNETENIPLNQTFTTMYEEYQKLDYIKRVKALECYKSEKETSTKQVAIKKMLEYIKRGLKDEQEE